MKKNIAIIGAGGFGRETACCLRAINGESPSWNLIGFFDDGVAAGTENEYGRVLGTVEDLNAWKEPLSVVIAIASPRALERISGLLDNPLLDFPNIIAPDVKFYDRGRVAMGKGNVISFGHIFSCHVDMGDFNLFSCGSLIGHDVTLGNWNVVANGCKVSGGVTLGNANFLGAASVVLPCRTVKENVVLGANSTLVRDALVGGTYAGCPAVLKKKPSPAPEKKSTVWLSLACTGEAEERFVHEAFESKWVTTVGPNVDAFERELEEYLGETHVVALASGTSALHLGLVMLGVGPGDEVLCQSMTFAASANPIITRGLPRCLWTVRKRRGTCLRRCWRKPSGTASGRRAAPPKPSFRWTSTACPPAWGRSWRLPGNTAFPCWRTPRKRWVPNTGGGSAGCSARTGPFPLTETRSSPPPAEAPCAARMRNPGTGSSFTPPRPGTRRRIMNTRA